MEIILPLPKNSVDPVCVGRPKRFHGPIARLVDLDFGAISARRICPLDCAAGVLPTDTIKTWLADNRMTAMNHHMCSDSQCAHARKGAVAHELCLLCVPGK